MRTALSLVLISAFALNLASCSNQTNIVTPLPVSSSSSSVPSEPVIILSPASGSLVRSQLTVQGKARGAWFFEGTLPVQLQDSDGNVITTVPAHAEGEWMTPDYVNFTVVIPFTTTATSGFLVIKKDNPSGLPENDGEFLVPVTF